MNDLLVIFWLVGPAVLGLVAIMLAVILLRKPAGASANTTARQIVGALCVLLALGIGGCYGLLLMGGGI